MKWIRSSTAVVALVAVVAALTISLGAWQGWLAQAADDTYIVNDDLLPAEGGCDTPDFETDDIDAVIDHMEVSDGDTLVICEGTYAGAVIVDKSLTIEGREGADRDNIVVEGTSDGFVVTADDVTVRHIRFDAVAGNGTGVYVTGDNATIQDVELTDWGYGVYVEDASDTLIEDSYIHDANWYGIGLDDGSGHHIARNDITDNGSYGIKIEDTDLAVVEDNTISENQTYQLRILDRSHVQVLRNTIVTGSDGISLDVVAEALVIIGGSDANANTFDGDLAADEYYIELKCASQATVNATHNYWKGAPAVSRGVAGVIFNDEYDDGTECPDPNRYKGAVVFHPVAPGPAPAPSPSPTPTPSPTVTPTPSPTPTATRTFDLPQGWNNFVWTGADATAAETALSCIAGPPVQFAIAYHWDGSAWYKYVPDRPDITDLTTVDKYDSLLVLITASGAQCADMPVEP